MALLAVTIAMANALGMMTLSPPRSQQAPPDHQGEPTKAEKQNSGSAEPSGASHSQENKNASHKERYWYSTFLDHPTEWLLAIFTFFLAVYTARLFYATAGLVGAAREQSRDTKASIAVAEKSADASLLMAKAMIGSELPVIHGRWMGIDLLAVDAANAAGRTKVTGFRGMTEMKYGQ